MKTNELTIGDRVKFTSKRKSVTNAIITYIDAISVCYTDIDYPNIGLCSYLRSTLDGAYYTIEKI